jgi:CRISPR-associated endonuclease/helicase Cas3
MTYLAHTKNGRGEPHILHDHLKAVGELAAQYAAQVHPELALIARWAGLLHDIGKYRDAFQNYLLDANKQRGSDPDTHHAVYGAALAYERGSTVLPFAIAGHHTGLHDPDHLMEKVIERPSYHAFERLPEVVARFQSELGAIPEVFNEPEFVGENAKTDLYVRMLFSALVDADFLDTEKHFLCGVERSAPKLRPVELLAQLGEAKERKARKAFDEATTDEAHELVRLRNSIYDQCVRAGELPQDFFNLTVPTGGGKTLAGMAFALAHAARHDLRRVIVVIPYLSIIEQNADEYRRMIDPNGDGVVIENHSAVVQPPQEEGAEIRSPLEYAAENWDASVIVTTAVQFVESLFANRPSRCRKLHNLVRSVVLLDEAQTLPAHLLHPLLSVMRELKESYGVSFVFSTATQFAFRRSYSLKPGFKEGETTNIIENAGDVFKRLQRVRYEFPKGEEQRGWQEIASEMQAQQQALCVVNTRRHARDLWEEVRRAASEDDAKSIFHLSSAMCAEHRLAIIGSIENPQEDSIRWRLNSGLPCRVVSTQLIEAGVDLDFPLVLRALAPLDSIVQAAGRCNREGRLRDAEGRQVFGRVIVFNPADEGLPSGSYRTGTQAAASLLNRLEPDSLATDYELFAKYFSSLYSKLNEANTGEQIERDRCGLRFKTVAKAARVIQDEGSPVIVPYGEEWEKIVKEIRARAEKVGRPFIKREDFRRLQRFMVSVRENDFKLLEQRGGLRKLFPQFPHFDAGIHLLNEAFYHPQLGVVIDGRPATDWIV